MAQATLSEQMGAMALIDQLRQQQMVVQEHLNLPQRREEVARRIRDYYQSRNIAVDDAVVAQGVRAYFDRRLVFEAPRLGKVANSVANLYVTRSRWMKPVAGVMLALTALVTGGFFAHGAYQQSKTDAVQARSDEASWAQAKLQRSLDEQTSLMNALRERIKHHPLPSAERMMQEIPPLLAQAAKLGAQSLPQHIDAKTRDAAGEAILVAQQALDHAQEMVATAAGKIVDTTRVMDAYERFVQLSGTPQVAQAGALHPPIGEALRVAQRDLDSADTSGAASAEASVRKLAQLVADAPSADALGKGIDASRAKLQSLLQAREDREHVDSLAIKGMNAVKMLDIPTASSVSDEMTRTANYAMIPLTLRIVDRAGVKSGVERRYKPSGGKSWFLIVEALDAAGNIVPVPVESTETGVRKNADKFGIRVSQEEYQRVKEAKMRTGHVEQRDIGFKPANALAFTYSRGISSQPDTILEW